MAGEWTAERVLAALRGASAAKFTVIERCRAAFGLGRATDAAYLAWRSNPLGADPLPIGGGCHAGRAQLAAMVAALNGAAQAPMACPDSPPGECHCLDGLHHWAQPDPKPADPAPVVETPWVRLGGTGEQRVVAVGQMANTPGWAVPCEHEYKAHSSQCRHCGAYYEPPAAAQPDPAPKAAADPYKLAQVEQLCEKAYAAAHVPWEVDCTMPNGMAQERATAAARQVLADARDLIGEMTARADELGRALAEHGRGPEGG